MMRKLKIEYFLVLISLLLFSCVTNDIKNDNETYTNDSDIFVKGGLFSVYKNTYKLDSFYISKAEVTVKEYCEIMAISYDKTISDYPMTDINWFEAINYCNLLSKNTGLELVYTINDETGAVQADFNKNGYRLPTKAEWYWAAKGAASKNFNNFSGANESNFWDVQSYAWFILNSSEKIHPVATKSPNDIGLYDMSGNASEWCWDYYWTWNEKQKYIITFNPKGPEIGTYRCVSGGFYGNSAEYINLIESQTKQKPIKGEIYCGFRVARKYNKVRTK